MRMKDPAREVKQAFKRWNVWYRIVTRGDDNIVKCFSWKNFISDKVFDNHSEVISLLIVDNIFDSSAEVYILLPRTPLKKVMICLLPTSSPSNPYCSQINFVTTA